LNVVFNADANKTSGAGEGGQIVYNGQIYTNGGNVAMSAGWTPNAGGSSAIALNGAVVDTRVGRTDAGAGGNVVLDGFSGTLFGNINNSSAAVLINSSQISTSTGSVTINGTSTTGTGVEVSASQVPATISTTSGNVAITGLGTGRVPAGSGALLPSAGVLISRASIGTVSGGIVLHGYVNDTAVSPATRAGVLVQDGAQLATTGGGDIELTGRAVANGAGVSIAPGTTPAGLPGVAPAITGSRNVVLRAANNGTTDAIAIAAPVSAGNVIDLRPGGTDAAGVASDAPATPITLASPAAVGFDVSAAELGLLSAPTIVAGSNAQTGDISVLGPVAVARGLTLQTGGGGNIALNAPVAAVSMGLLAGGSVSQAAGAPITAGTLLARATTGSVLLGSAANNVGTVGGSAAGSFTFVNAGALTLGQVSVNGFDAAGNQPQTATAASMAADTVFVRTLAGDLALGADVSSGSGADLVAAARFQNLGAFGIAGAPWRVWADTWLGESRGGLFGSGTTPSLYHCAYLGLCTVAISPADNHFIYAQQPVATVVIGDQSRFYRQPNPPFFTYSISGLILGDTGVSFSGATGTTANFFSPPGLYPITGTFQSAAGYAVNVVPGTLRVALLPVLPLPDVLRDVPNTYTFDRNIGPAPMCYATGPLDGDRAAQGADVLAREWSRVRSRPNLLSCVDTERRNGCADF
ncbi:MAG: filamentous hemagglutinin family outer membrane protein, partial [Variovorax sp.]|nr:filamentous hemagglutinin family outer membrane protein [Variovorax sp.]